MVRGNPQQVQQAISMIAEKAGVPVVSFLSNKWGKGGGGVILILIRDDFFFFK